MELLGDRNWWLPAWLDRLLPKFSIEGHAPVSRETGPVAPAQDPAPVPTAAG